MIMKYLNKIVSFVLVTILMILSSMRKLMILIEKLIRNSMKIIYRLIVQKFIIFLNAKY